MRRSEVRALVWGLAGCVLVVAGVGLWIAGVATDGSDDQVSEPAWIAAGLGVALLGVFGWLTSRR